MGGPDRRCTSERGLSPRIAVSGSHATGKTSLVSDLVGRIANLTPIDEPYYLLEQEGHAFKQPPTDEDFEVLLERSLALFAEPQAGAVIFDRSPADYVAYLTARNPGTVRSEAVADVAAALATLDLMVFVPIEDPDRISGVEAPRLRRRVDGILREMLLDGGWGFDVPVVEVYGTLAQRAGQVEARLALLATDLKGPRIRLFQPGDASAVSDLIRTTMATSNQRDYEKAILEPLIDYFSPEKVKALAAERFCIVAEDDVGRIIGTAALEGTEVLTFFVRPESQGHGVGTALLEALETEALRRGETRLTVDSSVTGAPFYEARGFRKTGRVFERSAGTQVSMEKVLRD